MPEFTKSPMRIISFLIIFLIFVEACVPTYFDRTKVKTTSSQLTYPNKIHINNLFVLAKGTNATRLVSNNIYSAIEELMKANGSKSEFEFRNVFRNTQQIDIASTGNSFDGYLLISSRDSASIKANQSKFVFGVPTSGTSTLTGTGYGRAFEDVFLINVYNSEKELIYTGEISFHFDPTKEELYETVARKLVKQLSLSNIMLW